MPKFFNNNNLNDILSDTDSLSYFNRDIKLVDINNKTNLTNKTFSETSDFNQSQMGGKYSETSASLAASLESSATSSVLAVSVLRQNGGNQNIYSETSDLNQSQIGGNVLSATSSVLAVSGLKQNGGN